MKPILILAVCLSLAMPGLPPRADNVALEMRELMRLVKELDYLIEQTDELRGKKHDQSVQFNYQAMMNDLIRIRELIRQHMVVATQSPNTIRPMDGEDKHLVSHTYTGKP